MTKRNYDPLSCIPPATAVEENLKHAVETVRRLRVLLKTAKKIEERVSQTRNREVALG